MTPSSLPVLVPTIRNHRDRLRVYTESCWRTRPQPVARSGQIAGGPISQGSPVVSTSNPAAIPRGHARYKPGRNGAIGSVRQKTNSSVQPVVKGYGRG